jgi:hypothetical protein
MAMAFLVRSTRALNTSHIDRMVLFLFVSYNTNIRRLRCLLGIEGNIRFEVLKRQKDKSKIIPETKKGRRASVKAF